MGKMKKIPLPVLLAGGFILALLVRLLLIPNPGFEADVSFWKSWGLAVLDYGIIKGLPLTNFNYPTPFGYFLALMVGAYSLFSDPHNFNQFWLNTNLLFLFVSKMPAIIADFGVAGIFLWIGVNPKKFHFPPLPVYFYALLSLIFLFNPISIMDGAWWGQLDSLGVLLFLFALLALLRGRPFWAGVIFMVSMMTKLQNMIYGPIFFLFVWQLDGFGGLVASASGALLTFAGLNIEFILSHNMARVLESLTGNYDYFPWLSLNAFNPWWIYSGAAGMKGSDKILSIGLASAKNVGLFVFSAGYLFAVLFMKPFAWIQKRVSDKSGLLFQFLTAFMIVNGSFFLFQTESHDRYAFPFIIMLLLWAPFFVKKIVAKQEVVDNGKLLAVSVVYVLFSLLYAYNLYWALTINYPANGISFLHTLITPNLTIAVSYIFTGVFLWFLLYLNRITTIWNYILPILFVLAAITVKNIPLIVKQPVYVSGLTPTSYKQDYGGRAINMPTNALTLGFKSWSALSVQYAFYRHGIGTHANSFQIFDIGGLFKKFTFDYGIDTEAGPKGSVTFEVYGDGKKLFASEKIGRYEYPRHAEVDVTNVHLLKLVVTDAGDGITDDHADWLNPKLYE